MSTTLKTRLVRMGNSQGIRIPKIVIDQLGLGAEVQLEVRADRLIIRPVRTPRQGWEEQFARMAAQGDDRLLDADAPVSTAWDENEWKW